MKQKIPIFLFYSFLGAVTLLEGFGVKGGRETAFYLILIMPLTLWVLELLLRNKVIIPKQLTLYYSLFLLASFASTVFSIDIVRSIFYLQFYIAIYLIFLYTLNYRHIISQTFIAFIFALSFIFSVYSLFIGFFWINKWYFLVPEHGYQFVFSRFGSHNHIGDFLILPLLICFYHILRNKLRQHSIVFVAFLFPFFIFSYSRSAYVAFFMILVAMLLTFYKKESHVKKSFWLLVGIVLVVCITFFFATVKEAKQLPILSTIHKSLSFNLHNKDFLAKRDILIQDASSSILERPLLGVGPYNYVYISGKSSTFHDYFSYSSHNIFMDIAVENGIIALIFFTLFILSILIKSKGRTVFFFLCIALFINFQTDYTHTIYSFLLLFFILLALNGGGYMHSSHSKIKKQIGVNNCLLDP